MSRKVSVTKLGVSSQPSVLLVGPMSDSLDRRKALREASGFEVILADNICYAEIFSETRRYDASLQPHEQSALPSVMRVRWHWNRNCRAH